MRLQNISRAPQSNDACPVCGAGIRLAEIEPHPARAELEILGFHCDACGPVKSLVVVCQVQRTKRRLC
jgi:hypothetical protein